MHQLTDPSQPPDRANCIPILLFISLAVGHVLGLFSVGLLMGEGRLQCWLLGAVTLLLARTTLCTVLRAQSAAQQVSQRSTADEQTRQCAALMPGFAACVPEPFHSPGAALQPCQSAAAGWAAVLL